MLRLLQTLGILLLGLAVLLIILLLYFHNRFVRLKVEIQEAWSSIDIQLQQRYDLIPRLEKAMAQHIEWDKDLSKELQQAREKAMQRHSLSGRAEAEQRLSYYVQELLSQAEEQPELQKEQNFRDYQEALMRIEQRVRQARRYHNALVRDYNLLCQSFPGVLFAQLMGHKTLPFFEATNDEFGV